MPVGGLGGRKNPKKIKVMRMKAAALGGNPQSQIENEENNYELWVHEDLTNISYWIS